MHLPHVTPGWAGRGTVTTVGADEVLGRGVADSLGAFGLWLGLAVAVALGRADADRVGSAGAGSGSSLCDGRGWGAAVDLVGSGAGASEVAAGVGDELSPSSAAARTAGTPTTRVRATAKPRAAYSHLGILDLGISSFRPATMAEVGVGRPQRVPRSFLKNQT